MLWRTLFGFSTISYSTTKTRKVNMNIPLLQRRRTSWDKTCPASVVWWRRGKTWRLTQNEWAQGKNTTNAFAKKQTLNRKYQPRCCEARSIHEAVNTTMISRGRAVTAVSVDHVRVCCWRSWVHWSVEECLQTLWQQNSKQENRTADAWLDDVTRV